MNFFQIRHLRLVPTLVTYLLKDPKVDEYDLSSLEAASCGAAPLKYEIEEAFKNKFHLEYVQQGYGLTECTLIASLKVPENTKPATVGSAIAGTQMKVTWRMHAQPTLECLLLPELNIFR